MITRSAAQPASHPVPHWQRLLAEAVSDPAELLGLLNLPSSLLPGGQAAAALFPLRVPRGFVARMRPGDPADPLLLQVLPVGEEALTVPGFGPDPLMEAAATAEPGLLHKYRGRALLITTAACAVHCRYCFRREFPYEDHQIGAEGWRPALEYLARDPSIREVLLSGGDPLVLSDRRLAALAAELAAIPHLERLRIHSRTPVVLPERLDDSFQSWIGATRLKTVLVLHANHPRELGDELARGVARLRAVGTTVLNQSVLLRGVNDDVDTLAELSERLFDLGILPYYLYLLDRVTGAAHFEVSEERARELVRGLQGRLPGYLVPRLVREVPGEAAKVPTDLRWFG
ncbi:MAG: EF-P beta-lysylation protein EpmB [Thermoanaerobaculia bacterium]|nr:EF-P beta-lysylation protein EpmB [Thermoanaerobaculia bacterium]